MAHNFKLTGDYYVSIDGSDSNNGLTKDTPKRTIQAGLNLISGTVTKTLIIGAGVYNETLNRNNSTSITTVRADGYVVIEGTGGKTFTYTGTGNPYTTTFYDIEFRNFPITYFNVSNTWISYIGCRFINIGNTNTSTLDYSPAFDSCIIANCTFTNTSQTTLNINKSVVINTSLGFIRSLTNTYFNSSCYLYFSSSSAVYNNYNNIQCPIIMNTASTVTTGVYQDVYGRYYDLSITTSTGDGGVSTPFGRPYTNGAAFSFATHRILYPTYNANSFSADPKFNNIEAQDFTLQATSPHIGRASDGTNIGGTKYAVRYAAKGAEFNTSAVSVTGLAFVGNDWSISGGTTGEVVSAPILISATAKVLQKISYNGLLEFNKSVTGGTAGNRNVPDQEVYDSTTQPPNVAGANPDRLVYYMRYSTQAAQPSTNSEWDNGGYWTAGNYGTFEWNTKPSIDNAFLGNGDPSFNSGVTPTFLNVTWIQLKVKLRNDYV